MGTCTGRDLHRKQRSLETMAAEVLDRNVRLAAKDAEIERLRAALAALDAVLDFGEPYSEDKPWIFEDGSELNAAFEQARKALGHEQSPRPTEG